MEEKLKIEIRLPKSTQKAFSSLPKSMQKRIILQTKYFAKVYLEQFVKIKLEKK